VVPPAGRAGGGVAGRAEVAVVRPQPVGGVAPGRFGTQLRLPPAQSVPGVGSPALGTQRA